MSRIEPAKERADKIIEKAYELVEFRDKVQGVSGSVISSADLDRVDGLSVGNKSTPHNQWWTHDLK